MFHLDSDDVYRTSFFDDISWLEHGFGTRLAAKWAPRERLTSVRQIHSDKIIIADGKPGLIGEGDALITSQSGTLLSVRTADCLPILIADLRNRAVAAVHAGWRGTLAAIAVKTVQALERQFGSRRADLRIAIGPGIGPCCFEVGSDVAVQFGTLFPDLAEANRRQLIAEGIAPDHITAAGLCTCCDGAIFHSYRRDREQSGRMISAVGISRSD